jgi:hypothetical protein
MRACERVRRRRVSARVSERSNKKTSRVRERIMHNRTSCAARPALRDISARRARRKLSRAHGICPPSSRYTLSRRAPTGRAKSERATLSPRDARRARRGLRRAPGATRCYDPQITAIRAQRRYTRGRATHHGDAGEVGACHTHVLARAHMRAPCVRSRLTRRVLRARVCTHACIATSQPAAHARVHASAVSSSQRSGCLLTKFYKCGFGAAAWG